MPLHYLTNPEHIIGDAVDGAYDLMNRAQSNRPNIFGTSRDDARENERNRTIPGATLKKGLGMAPMAALNVGVGMLGATSKGVLPLVNEIFNPIAGTGQLAKTVANKAIGKNIPLDSKAIQSTQGAAPTKKVKPLPYQTAEPIGNTLQIGSLMKGSPLEKQVNAGTGQIATGNVRNFLNSKGVSAADKRVLTELLDSPQFAGKKKISYEELREASSNTLVDLKGKVTPSQWDNYGTESLGYRHQYGHDTPFLDNKSIKYSNKAELGVGSDNHGFGEDALAHSRVLVTKKEPDVFHVLESQSDLYQGKGWQGRVTKQGEISPKSLENNIKNLDNAVAMRRTEIDGYGNPIEHSTVFQQIDDNIKRTQENLDFIYGNAANPTQKLNIGNNIELRLMQEDMNQAVKSGQSKMRYPTA